MPKSKKNISKKSPSHAHSYLVLSESRLKLQFLVLALFTITAFLLYFVVKQDQKLKSLKDNSEPIVTLKTK